VSIDGLTDPGGLYRNTAARTLPSRRRGQPRESRNRRAPRVAFPASSPIRLRVNLNCWSLPFPDMLIA
jgi:hypothetical protein